MFLFIVFVPFKRKIFANKISRSKVPRPLLPAKKDKQFGFIVDDRLVFCGDEPLSEDLFDLVKNKDWLIHESFCLDIDKDLFKPHQKGHCTVKDAAIIAKNVNVKNLVLIHTEDKDLKNRKILYASETKMFYDGNVIVPNDLETIEL